MSDFTEAQRTILSVAAQHPGGAVLPLPGSLKLDKPTGARILKSLLKRGLIAEHLAKDGKRLGPVLTSAGRRAIDAKKADQPGDKPVKVKKAPKAVRANTKASAGRPAAKPAAEPPTEPPAAPPRKGTKLALLTELLRRKGGASIAEAVKATGWQAHSVRGAISGALKNKRGLAVAAESIEGRGRVYRIAP